MAATCVLKMPLNLNHPSIHPFHVRRASQWQHMVNWLNKLQKLPLSKHWLH